MYRTHLQQNWSSAPLQSPYHSTKLTFTKQWSSFPQLNFYHVQIFFFQIWPNWLLPSWWNFTRNWSSAPSWWNFKKKEKRTTRKWDLFWSEISGDWKKAWRTDLMKKTFGWSDRFWSEPVYCTADCGINHWRRQRWWRWRRRQQRVGRPTTVINGEAKEWICGFQGFPVRVGNGYSREGGKWVQWMRVECVFWAAGCGGHIIFSWTILPSAEPISHNRTAMYGWANKPYRPYSPLSHNRTAP